METVTDFIFLGSKIPADDDCSHEVKRCLLLKRKAMTNLDSLLKKQRHYFADKCPSNQHYDFSSSHVWMWELDYKENWAPKNWCFWLWCWIRLFFFFHLILFFNFTILCWFCHISTWLHHRYTCVPHPEPSSFLRPHTIPLCHPSAPAPKIQYHASNLDWRLVSYMIWESLGLQGDQISLS